MNTKQETIALLELGLELPNVHVAAGFGTVSVTVFDDKGEVDWQQNLYEWSHDEAYLPKLRFVRNELEELYREALAQREQVAA